MITQYQPQQINTDVNYSNNNSSILRNQASATQQLSQQLQGFANQAIKTLEPIITKQTVDGALKDIEDGNVDSERVALVARDTYQKTAISAFEADIELRGNALGKNEIARQTELNQFNTQAFNKAWGSYQKTVLDKISDPSIKASVSSKLAREGQQFSAQVTTLEIKQQKQRNIATFDSLQEMNKEKLLKSVVVNPEEALRLSSEIYKTIEQQVAQGYITPAQGEEKIGAIKKEMNLETIQKSFTNALQVGIPQAEKYISNFVDSEEIDLIPTEKQAVLIGLYAQLNRKVKLEKNKVTMNTQEDKLFVKNVTDQMNNLEEIPLENIAEATKIAGVINSPPLTQALNNAKELAIYNEMLGGLPITEKTTHLNILEQKDDKTPSEMHIAQAMRKTLSKEIALAKNDPIQLMYNNGDIEVTNPIELDNLSALPDRRKALAVGKELYGVANNLLLKEEVQMFMSFFNDPNTTTTEKQEMIEQFSNYGEATTEAVFNQLSSKGGGILQMASELTKSGNLTASKRILEGMMTKEAIAPDIAKSVREKLRGIFGNFSPEKLENMYAGIIAYGKSTQAFHEGAISADEMLEKTIGKVVTYNNQKVIIPQGMTQNDFEDALDGWVVVGDNELTNAINGATDNAFNLSSMGAKNYQLAYHSPGKYLVRGTENGRPYNMADPTDPTGKKPYILDLTR